MKNGESTKKRIRKMLTETSKVTISTTDAEHFKKIFSLIPKIKDAPYTEKEFKVWWIKNYLPTTFRVWIETDDDGKEVYSFVIAQIVKPMLDDEVFILLASGDPESGCGQELMDRVEGWARIKGIKKISAYIYRSPEGFCKKYSFSKGFTEIFKSLKY